ncbi:MAG: hypothetical protein OSA99_16455, partial [Acidimicrobiales bacterium]|nr:hypothetical protein [Acidimicrobiales bacterium]
VAVVHAVMFEEDEHVEAVVFAPCRLVERGAVQVRMRRVAAAGGAQVVSGDEEATDAALQEI